MFKFLNSGVVFNEMKGVYSQPDSILGRTSQQASLMNICCLIICLKLEPLQLPKLTMGLLLNTGLFTLGLIMFLHCLTCSP